MSVENNVNVQNRTNYHQSNVSTETKAQPNVKPNTIDKTPDKDMVQLSGLTTKEKVGIGVTIATGVALATLTILGRNGCLGEWVQKFLGGKSKEIKNAIQETTEHIKAPTTAHTAQGTETIVREVKKAKDIINTIKTEDSVIKKALDYMSDIELVGQSSVPMMIDTLERGYYLEILKNLAKTKNSQELSKALQKLNKKSYNLSVGQLFKEFESKIDFDLLLKQQNEQLSKIGKQINFPEGATPSEKLGILMTAGLEKGRTQAMATIGTSYKKFEEGMVKNEDVSVFYDGIKKNIDKAIEFLI